MAKSTNINTIKKQLIDALEKSLGIVTTACKSVGIDRTTFYNYYNKDEEFKNKVDNIGEIAIDFVESKLFEQVKSGNTTASIFYLKTKAKHRGYIERQEHAGVEGAPIEIIINKKYDKE